MTRSDTDATTEETIERPDIRRTIVRDLNELVVHGLRELIEQVSPGPYLELYGREEHPNTDWTVYGNQIERRLF